MTLIELMALTLLWFLAALLGIYGSKYIGWWAWLPAIGLGSLLMFIAVAGVVKEVRASIAIVSQKLRGRKSN